MNEYVKKCDGHRLRFTAIGNKESRIMSLNMTYFEVSQIHINWRVYLAEINK